MATAVSSLLYGMREPLLRELDLLGLARLSQTDVAWRRACAPHVAARQAALIARLPMTFVEMHVDAKDGVARALLTDDDLVLEIPPGLCRRTVRVYAVLRYVPSGGDDTVVCSHSSTATLREAFQAEASALDDARARFPLSDAVPLEPGNLVYRQRNDWTGGGGASAAWLHADAYGVRQSVGWCLAGVDAVAGVFASGAASFAHHDGASNWRRLLRTVNAVCERIIKAERFAGDVERGDRFAAQIGAVFADADHAFAALVDRRIRAQLRHDRRVFAV